jgi:hypothetical protein
MTGFKIIVGRNMSGKNSLPEMYAKTGDGRLLFPGREVLGLLFSLGNPDECRGTFICNRILWIPGNALFCG